MINNNWMINIHNELAGLRPEIHIHFDLGPVKFFINSSEMHPMNVKGLLGNMITTPIRNGDGTSVNKVEKTIKSDESHDRDPNGQQSFGDQRKDQGPMSDEQFEQALILMQSLPSVKEHSWKVEKLLENEKRFLIVKDNMGKVVRRIPEADLWSLPFDKDARTGQLLKKSA